MTGQATQTINGLLTLLPIPCTTKPCLPGMALAVMADNNVQYFLTKDNRFYMQDFGEHNPMPAPGDKVIATGKVQEKQDITGNTFRTIELITLRQANTNP